MKCPECGFDCSLYKEGSGWVFCPNCGSRVNQRAPSVTKKCAECHVFSDRCDYVAAFCVACGSELSATAIAAAEKDMLPGALVTAMP